MLDTTDHTAFPSLNRAYNRVFQPNRLTIGLVAPLESYETSAVPSMERHIERAKLAETLGFSALWLRDVPFNVPAFGDAGQIFDPFVYLGALAAVTNEIALGVASVILPLRHPAHVAKAAASADSLSGGRLLLGIASGDRPEEYPAMNKTFPDRGERFRESVAYMTSLSEDYPQLINQHGTLSGGIDMLPKPVGGRIPILITGGSQQSSEWIAAHGDGWITYPRDARSQGRLVADYRRLSVESGHAEKPVMQSLYVDLVDDPDASPRPIHLGFRSGVAFLRAYLSELEALGINHVALNLRFNQSNVETTMTHLSEHVLPGFSA